MEIDPKILKEGIRKILEVEHAHLFGAKTGSDTARRKDVEAALSRVMDDISKQSPSSFLKTSDVEVAK